ncbi:hypothetical protein MRX96_002719 [Rhipicephalus microplus]
MWALCARSRPSLRSSRTAGHDRFHVAEDLAGDNVLRQRKMTDPFHSCTDGFPSADSLARGGSLRLPGLRTLGVDAPSDQPVPDMAAVVFGMAGILT